MWKTYYNEIKIYTWGITPNCLTMLYILINWPENIVKSLCRQHFVTEIAIYKVQGA